MHDVPTLGNLLGRCLQLLICALIQLASCSLEVTKNKQYKKKQLVSASSADGLKQQKTTMSYTSVSQEQIAWAAVSTASLKLDS